ncbi:hypothetical protein [Polaromonas sp. JS666]|uniref:hypothetical protein n=1 Tax=Polaromonas sp. (strain JS666 / ATCC BAA-500) TaxID=296591 RepID=UPI0000536EAC|nr:hypothetical protein [Polaromonas sp. JS666]ABE44658.1 hypothetical protein Bpro_2742 [Polaromonas sp. JS666]
MNTVAIIFDFKALPFKLDLQAISLSLDERIRATGPVGYLGKVMSFADGLPTAILFAYDDSSTPDADEAITAVMSIIGQAAVAFGGWSLWDQLRDECGAFQVTKEEIPDLHAQLTKNLNLDKEPGVLLSTGRKRGRWF